MVSITINSQKSIFDKMVCNEVFDKKLIEKIISSDIIKKEENKKSLIYLKNKNKSGKVLKSKYSRKIPYGRFYPKKSLSLLERTIRHTLFFGLYTDIDMENCFFNLFYEIFKNNYEDNVKTIKYYIDNREEVLNEIMEEEKVERDDAKKIVLKSVYKDEIDTENETLLKICNETKLLAKIVMDANVKLTKKVKD